MGSPKHESSQVAEEAVTKNPSDDAVEDRTHDIDPKEERAFVSTLMRSPRGLTDHRKVWRLDVFFLTIGFLGYMFKYIDQTNIVRPSLTPLSPQYLIEYQEQCLRLRHARGSKALWQ